jgi:hypothetical protein
MEASDQSYQSCDDSASARANVIIQSFSRAPPCLFRPLILDQIAVPDLWTTLPGAMKPVIAVPAVAALVYRAWSRKSLTPLGIIVAAMTAVAHAVHPWSIFFALLVVFFLGGTTATKVRPAATVLQRKSPFQRPN